MDTALRLDATWVDYLLVALYFVFVLGIGWAAKARVSSSIDFSYLGAGCQLGSQVLPLSPPT